MSHNWTYEIPEPDGFKKALLYYINKEGEHQLFRILSKSSLSFELSQTFGHRNHSYKAGIKFHIPTQYMDVAEQLLKEDLESKIIRYADKLMPFNAGFDIYWLEIVPSLDNDFYDNDISDIDHVIENLTELIYVPEDFISKMKEMARIYSYLYLVENSLRLFVLNVITQNYKNTELMNLPILLNSQKNKIKQRKELEKKKRWLRARGDSDIYYLDFNDILSIIRENWTIFKKYFMDLDWIKVKLEELRDCRNIVAHNGYLGETEKKLIQTNYEQILMQISIAL